MKNLLTAFLPALALLALGGCASTSGLATSEDDGVYYSSQDHTTAVARAAPAQEPGASTTEADAEEAANPDYRGNTANKPSRRGNAGSDQYYDNSYTYMQGVPGYGPGVSYYVPYTPYTSLSYAGAWGMGPGFSPYGIYDPFYSPFYSPFYGSGISISLGFGRPWGYGGGLYGRPYGYGAFYDPFYYSSPFYGGYYGRGGYYGNNFYGNNFYGSNFGYGTRASGNDRVRVNRASGHLNRRDSDGRYTTGGNTSNPNGTGNISSRPTTGRARTEDRIAAPTTPLPDGALPTSNESRSRAESVSGNNMADEPAGRTDGYNRPRRAQRAQQQPAYGDLNQPADAGRVVTEDTRGRVRDNQNAAPQPQAAPQETQRRRGWLQIPAEPSNAGSQATEQPQPVRRRDYDQPRQEQRSYEQPRQQSYEQPQRASQPSYSAPSNSSPSNSGGGNSGGSRGRGRAD